MLISPKPLGSPAVEVKYQAKIGSFISLKPSMSLSLLLIITPKIPLTLQLHEANSNQTSSLPSYASITVISSAFTPSVAFTGLLQSPL